MPAKVTLTVIEGSLKGQEFAIDSRTTCIMGRAKDCHPQIPDDQHHRTISRYHCLLDINPPDIRVRDFGSLNGTYVNGKKIGQRLVNQSPEEGSKMKFPEYDLKSGDVLKLGNTVFRVSTESASEDEFTQLPNVVSENSDFSDLLSHTVGDYAILADLGKSGYTSVYFARHRETRDSVALKLLSPVVPVNRRAREWLFRQAENIKALHHHNLALLREYGYTQEGFFFALEYCKAGNLLELMRQQNNCLSVGEALPIILQVLEGLEYAHQAEIPYVKQGDGTLGKGRGLVHGNVKPANILFTYSGKNKIVKLTDYAISKAFDLAGFSGQSMTGSRAGTPGFIPRQQVLNVKYMKPEVDLWSAAASLYYMLTGCYPRNFDGKEPFLVVLQTNTVPIRHRNSAIPQALAEVIDQALIDNPEIYFKTATDLKQALIKAMS